MIFCYTLYMNNIIENIEDLGKWVGILLGELGPRESATIISLSGDLGVGKTALVKEAAKILKIQETITSPTFVIQKEYLINNKDFPFRCMVHIDAYRLESAKELELLGWNDLIKDPQTIIFIEWPEQVSGIYLPQAESLHLSINKDQSRTIIKRAL